MGGDLEKGTRSMRTLVLGLSCGMFMACGVFGADDSPTPPPAADENAMPPPVGAPAPDGVFVSSSKGTDDGSGTQDRPFKTLKEGYAAAKERGLRVFACADTYLESLVIIDGVSAYGDYDCRDGWVRATKRAIIQSPTTPAVLAKGITMSTRLEGFEIRSPDLDKKIATETEGSTIALEVRESKSFVVSGSLLHAGAGAPGTDGSVGKTNARTGGDGTAAIPENYRTCNPALQMCDSIVLQGPGGGVATCAIGSSNPGGRAGEGQWYYYPSMPSKATCDWRGRPFATTTTTSVGGLNTSVNGYGSGLPGTAGTQGADGADGKNGSWSLTTKGFARGNGTAGTAGQPGLGGGGGGGARYSFTASGGAIPPPADAEYFATASGASGGAGGCGGQPGTPGSGGGASIGALVMDSAVVFERTRIESSAGGRAGKGNLGTFGTAGAVGGAPIVKTVEVTGRGGHGGIGGNGGASGHGAPGPTIALAYYKTRPVMADVELVSGRATASSQPALSVNATVADKPGTKTLPASDGVSVMEYEIKQ